MDKWNISVHGIFDIVKAAILTKQIYKRNTVSFKYLLDPKIHMKEKKVKNSQNTPKVDYNKVRGKIRPTRDQYLLKNRIIDGVS